MRWLLIKIKDDVDTFFYTLRSGINRLTGVKQQAVFVYQMGKVASSSIYASLRKLPQFKVYQVHRMNAENVDAYFKEQSQLKGSRSYSPDKKWLRWYKKYFVDSDEPIKIISLVREPIERNFSAFFQNLENFCDPNDKAATEGLIGRFISDYNHKVPLEWFDVEMKTTTGIDVYSKEFMHEEGYQIYKEGRYELLVLRVDLDDQTKEELVARFMGLDSFKLTMKNIGSKKSYSAQYKDFKNAISLDMDYVSKMLDSKYAQHFFSPNELKQARSKWIK